MVNVKGRARVRRRETPSQAGQIGTSRLRDLIRGSVVVLLQVGQSTPAIAQSSAAAARQAVNATVLIATVDAKGQPLALGSGFLVRPNVVATNAHVLDGASGASVKLVGKGTLVKISGVLARDRRRDLVLLSVSLPGVPPLAIAAAPAALADPIIVVGNPRGLEGTISEGIISGIREVGSDTLLQITAPISPGSSGGPVLARTGEVVGVAVASLRDGQNLNFAIPAIYLQQLLAVPRQMLPFRAEEKLADSSLARGVGGRAIDGISITNVQVGRYRNEVSFSLKNGLDRTVRWVDYIVIWYNESDGEPVHSDERRAVGDIRPGLAKRVEYSTTTNPGSTLARVEVRILDFALVNDERR